MKQLGWFFLFTAAVIDSIIIFKTYQNLDEQAETSRLLSSNSTKSVTYILFALFLVTLFSGVLSLLLSYIYL